ncbi:DUF1294 domain-containing protein [Colwellia sp. 75C3]|uniref:cold shock and DUF1294 domain-containing protein n=1 Tax=Colwellia sp. 75C3 TaxID=888425 RepID=UPI000C34073E|nr:cold shock and DUF1294 domain-containing protein [Colwellia sp. 75C3]PKG84983.1 DUF1294 domain-containing protein [Colwellia sp. 75C3]
MKGKIIKWNADKAFGFIAPNGGGDSIFIHKKALANRHRIPKINDVIVFKVTKDNQGRYCAEQATFSGEKLKKKPANSISKFSIYLALLFIGCLTAADFLGHLPQKILLIYLGGSLITFLAYAFDKSKAQRGKWRTQESTLHLLALIGGWPGAALAQQILRHKSKKAEFRVAFWFTVVANSAALAWLMSAHGEPFLSIFT